MLARLRPDQRREDQEPCSLGQGGDLLLDPGEGMAGERPAAAGAMGDAATGEQQPEVIVDFGQGGDRRAWIATRGAIQLADARGGGQSDDLIDRRPGRQIESATDRGGQTFQVAALPFGHDREIGRAHV